MTSPLVWVCWDRAMLVRSCSQALNHRRSICSSVKLPLIHATNLHAVRESPLNDRFSQCPRRWIFRYTDTLVTHLSRKRSVFVTKNSLSSRFRCATETLSIPCTTATPSSGTPEDGCEEHGVLKGTDHTPIEIDGLWGIGFGNVANSGPTPTRCSSPPASDEETHGLSGLSPRPKCGRARRI
jgi:hypothetical protein